MITIRNERGIALMAIMGMMLLMTFLGLSAFRWSMDELQMAANDMAVAQSHYMAESGINLILHSFHDPNQFPDSGTFPQGYPELERNRFLEKRMVNSVGAPSFLDDTGMSQFIGSAEHPDYLFEAESTTDSFLTEAFDGLGEITTFKLFSPESPGGVCTVIATGSSKLRGSRRVKVQMIPSPFPAMTAAVQTRIGVGHSVPILVHWGDVRMIGNADLGSDLNTIPQKDNTATINGDSYSLTDRKDGWVDFYVGELIMDPSTTSCSGCEEPFWLEGHDNIHQLQEQLRPPFQLDFWDYDQLRRLAKEHGQYYGTDVNGFLYEDGIKDMAHRRDVADILSSDGVGDGLGLVFIDTIDGKPPSVGNLAELHLPMDYLEGYFFIYAHVTVQNPGTGEDLQAFSPATEGTNDPSTRTMVTLSDINLNGVLFGGGILSFEGRPRIFGAISSDQGFGGPGAPEIWYNADLMSGKYPGLPVVTIMKGSWYAW